jgi:S-sulfosulfanyl-L-cysteine sulfohydrolase
MQQMGGYVKRCSGLRINIRIENPAGNRVQEIYYGDKHLDPDAVYKVSFVTSQGVPARLGKNRTDLDIKAIDALAAYLKNYSPFNNAEPDAFYLV